MPSPLVFQRAAPRRWRNILRRFPLMLLAAIGCTDTRETPMDEKINTPEGEYTAQHSTADSFPQNIKRVSGEELKWLRNLGTDGPGFVRTYLPDFPATSEPDLRDYDRAFRAWQLSRSRSHTGEEVIVLLGRCLGNKCVDDFDMEWVTVSDEHGTNYAIRSKAVEVMAFPFSTVTKRVDDQAYDFLYAVYHSIKQALDSGKYKEHEPAGDSGDP